MIELGVSIRLDWSLHQVKKKKKTLRVSAYDGQDLALDHRDNFNWNVFSKIISL